MADTDQLTVLPICPVCRKTQLTNEELVKGKETGTPRCWYCLVEALVQIGQQGAIPNPADWGRPLETKDHGIQLAKASRSMNVKDAMAEMVKSVAQSTVPPPVPGPTAGIKPVLQMGGATTVPLSEAERKEFIMKFGTDPVPKSAPYETIVHGAHEDLYLKFSCPVQIDLAYEREMKRIMSGLVEIFGKLVKYGPQFAGTLIELQAITPEMFLGGK